jgi:hypothetical protein
MSCGRPLHELELLIDSRWVLKFASVSNGAGKPPLLHVLTAAIPLLADLMETFTSQRAKDCRNYGNGPAHAKLWAILTGEEPHS